MISARVLSRLLRTLYGAPASPELWPEFLRELSQLLKLTGAAILHHDMEHARYNVQFSSDGEAEWMRLYQQRYGDLDIWRPAFLKKAEGEFVFGDELCPPEKAKNTEFYNDFLLKYDIRLFGAVATVKRPKQVEHLSLYQSWKGKSPCKETADSMALIFPHLRSALQLRREFVDLNVRNVSLGSAFDEIAAGIVLLDCNGGVLLMNRSATALLERADGLLIRNRRLRACRGSETARLDALTSGPANIGALPGAVAAGAVLISRLASAPLTITVAPLHTPATPLAHQASSIMFIHDPEPDVQLPRALLDEGYGLTPAEAQLALTLVKGHSLQEAADLGGVTHNTVRSQLKSIFMKTGVQRQGQLIRLLLRSGCHQRV
jgi:DNA-binding CsgD family transcriptional regulator/PAS domain-containing protein